MPGPLHSTASRQNLHESKRQKEPVRAASTANVSLSTPGAALDGVSLASGDRILLKDQTTASQNGIYLWTGASAALTRATDASASTDMLAGDQVYIREGTANGGSRWTLTTSAAITLGTTSLTYAREGGTGSFSGEVTGTDFNATGLTGSVAASRYVGATSSGAPSTGAHLLGDFVVDQTGKFWICTTAGTPGTWTQSASVAVTYSASGLTGATAASRYVGATTSGAPASGTFAAGDFVIDRTGKLWICTTAGSPGTWTQVSGGGGGTSASARLRRGSNQSITTATATAIAWDTEDTDTDSQHFTSSANLTGTVAKTASSANLVGTSTLFTTELSVGQVITVPGTASEVRVVTVITDDTHLTVNSNFANTASGQTAARVNSALVFRTAGFYWVQSGLLAGSASWTAQIRLNGSTIIGEVIPGAATTSFQVEAAQSFAQWDYLEVVVTQSSGSSVNITADQRTFLAAGMGGGSSAAAAVNGRFRISANQSIANATATAVAWDTEDTDTDNQHSNLSTALTGTVTKTNGSATLAGSSTLFTSELTVGQAISVPGGGATEIGIVTAITSNTSLTVATAFAHTSAGQTATRANSAIVIRTAGFYSVDLGATWAFSSSGGLQIQIRLNGATIIADNLIQSPSSTAAQSVMCIRGFTQWDYLEAIVTQFTAGSLNLTADERTHFALRT